MRFKLGIIIFFFSLFVLENTSADIVLSIKPENWTLFATQTVFGTTAYAYRASVLLPNGEHHLQLSLPSLIPPTFSNAGIDFILPAAIAPNGTVTGGFTTNYGPYPPLLTTLSETLEVHSSAIGLTCYAASNSNIVAEFPMSTGSNTISYAGASSILCVNRNPTNSIPATISDLSITLVGIQPSPTPSPTPTPTPTQFALDLSITPKSGRPNIEVIEGVPTLAMKPTTFGCGQIPFYSDERTFVLKCINKLTGESIAGCHYLTNLVAGPNKGGHEHDYDSRPLGQAYADETIPIPVGGLEFNYLAPEVSGDIDFSITGTGPNGESVSPTFLRLDLRAGDFKPIDVPFLTFDVQSHPLGTYGTEELILRVQTALAQFRSYVSAEGIQPIPVLESESASLPNGGLFDIDYATDFPWTPPHCSHRDGRRIDISLSPFNNYPPQTRDLMIGLLRKALNKTGLNRSLEKNHWHVGF